MDRVVRYAFCATAFTLTAAWLGTIVTGYSPSSRPPLAPRAFNTPAGEGIPPSELTPSARMMRASFQPLNVIVKKWHRPFRMHSRRSRVIRTFLLMTF